MWDCALRSPRDVQIHDRGAVGVVAQAETAQGEPSQETTAPPLLLLFCFSFSVRNDTTFRPTSGGLLLGPSLQIRKRPFCTRACTPREDYTNGI